MVLFIKSTKTTASVEAGYLILSMSDKGGVRGAVGSLNFFVFSKYKPGSIWTFSIIRIIANIVKK